jgi:hypothetical protein
MSRSMGAISAELVADLVFRRRVIALCRRPRLMTELLAEIAAEQNIRIEIEAKLGRYCGLPAEALASSGADRFQPAPLQEVPPAIAEDLREALDKLGGAPVVPALALFAAIGWRP